MGRLSTNFVALFAWSFYLPKLTPCDFFLWGWIKSHVYENKCDFDVTNTNTFDNLLQDMISCIKFYEHRLVCCIGVNKKSVKFNYILFV